MTVHRHLEGSPGGGGHLLKMVSWENGRIEGEPFVRSFAPPFHPGVVQEGQGPESLGDHGQVTLPVQKRIRVLLNSFHVFFLLDPLKNLNTWSRRS